MGRTQLCNLEGGEKLREPVIVNNEILIPAGSVLKAEYIDTMKTLGIESVVVEDSNEKKGTSFFLMEKEAYKKEIQNILERHIYGDKNSLKKLEPLAKEMIEQIAAMEEQGAFVYEERKADLYEHTIMTTALCLLVAKKLQLSSEEQTEIALGALLHDIGLRYTTVNYVNQSLEERDDSDLFEFKKHTVLGFSALERELWIPKQSKMMVLSHHERLDGSGYPLKQKNKEIGCRILQVCDVLDCMASGMECRRQTVGEAISYLKKNSGTLFDETVVKLLTESITW